MQIFQIKCNDNEKIVSRIMSVDSNNFFLLVNAMEDLIDM